MARAKNSAMTEVRGIMRVHEQIPSRTETEDKPTGVMPLSAEYDYGHKKRGGKSNAYSKNIVCSLKLRVSSQYLEQLISD